MALSAVMEAALASGRVLLHVFSVVCRLAVPSTWRFVAAVVRRVSFLARARVIFFGMFVF